MSYSFDFIQSDDITDTTRKDTINLYNIITNLRLWDWMKNYSLKCSDTNQQIVAEEANNIGLDGIGLGGAMMRLQVLAKYGYDELKRQWIQNNNQ